MTQERANELYKKQWILATEAKDLLGVTYMTVLNWIEKGKLDSYKEGPKSTYVDTDGVKTQAVKQRKKLMDQLSRVYVPSV